MTTEQLNMIALEIEAEELFGIDGRLLERDDILPVLELLWERRVDLGSGFDFDEINRDFSAGAE